MHPSAITVKITLLQPEKGDLKLEIVGNSQGERLITQNVQK